MSLYGCMSVCVCLGLDKCLLRCACLYVSRDC